MKITELTVTELLNLMGYAQAQLRQLPELVTTVDVEINRKYWNNVFASLKKELDSRIENILI